ncbi:PKD domain-containing protein [Emticicia agri]|uniref:PKD domain-containing protein n=1 Tax=Emticicia agri TaxID=2492393 RepID=A0A4Q5M5N7_9BACT|nr:PKD domain-containing protein [Emticicia agri]RYU97754.1 hypothetical protein EWM59_01135 [Emticicia agri]
MSGCDIRIKASIPTTGEETFTLDYLPNSINTFEDLGLEVVSNSGMPINNMSYLWTRPDGTTSTNSQLVVNKKGVYKVRLTVPNSTIGCSANTTLYVSNIEKEIWAKQLSTSYTDASPSQTQTQVTVVPIEYDGFIDIKMTDANGIPVTSPKYRTLISRLLIYQQVNGIRRSLKMHLFPSEEYMQTHIKISPADFTGLALFTDAKTDNFVGGHKYFNGAITKNYDIAKDLPCDETPDVDVSDKDVSVTDVLLKKKKPRWLENLLDFLQKNQTDCPHGNGSSNGSGTGGSNNGSSALNPSGAGSGSGAPTYGHGGVHIPPVIDPPQGDCPSDLALMSDLFTSLAKNAPQSGLVNFNATTNLYEITGDLEYFKSIYYLIESELKRIFPTNASNYNSPTAQQFLDAYNNLAAFYNQSNNNYTLSMSKLISNYTTPNCYYSNGTELIETTLKPKINSEITEIDKFKNTFGNDCGLAVYNLLKAKISAQGKNISDVLVLNQDEFTLSEVNVPALWNSLGGTTGTSDVTLSTCGIKVKLSLGFLKASLQFEKDNNALTIQYGIVPPPITDCISPTGGRLTENPIFPFVKEWMLNSLTQKGNSISSMSMVDCSTCSLTNMGDWGPEWGGRTYWLFKNSTGNSYWITREIGTTNYAYAYDPDPNSNANDHLTFTSWIPDFGEESTPGAKFSQYTANTFAGTVGVIAAAPLIVGSVGPAISNMTGSLTIRGVIEEVITNTLFSLATEDEFNPATLTKESVEGLFTSKLIDKVPSLIGKKFQIPAKVYSQLKNWLIEKGNTSISLDWLKSIRASASSLTDDVSNFANKALEKFDNLCSDIKDRVTVKGTSLKLFDTVDDVMKVFAKNNPLKTININGKFLAEVPGGNKSGRVKVFQGATEIDIRLYAESLAGGGLPMVKNGEIWSKIAPDGTKINLRNISTSADATGATWTIDLINEAKFEPLIKDAKIEIKFKP